MPKEAITFDMDSEQRAALDEIAEATRRNPSELIAEAIESYVDLQRRQIAHIKEGLAEADRGEFVLDEEIQQILAKYRVSQ